MCIRDRIRNAEWTNLAEGEKARWTMAFYEIMQGGIIKAGETPVNLPVYKDRFFGTDVALLGPAGTVTGPESSLKNPWRVQHLDPTYAAMGETIEAEAEIPEEAIDAFWEMRRGLQTQLEEAVLELRPGDGIAEASSPGARVATALPAGIDPDDAEMVEAWSLFAAENPEIAAQRVGAQPSPTRLETPPARDVSPIDRQSPQLSDGKQYERGGVGRSRIGINPVQSPEDLRQGYADATKPRLPMGPRRKSCLLYTSPSPRDRTRSRMPSSA